MVEAPLHLTLIPGDHIGWGICSKYLIRELTKLVPTAVVDPHVKKGARINGTVFHTIGDHRLAKLIQITGTENYGYTFFENLLPDEALENARAFNRIFAGSTWCKEKLTEKGISWSDVLTQGIDPDLFYPIEGDKPGAKDFFVIYSGGKFELRKGQDLVIRAVKVMQDRHKDILFVNCWHNSWPISMNTMAHSGFILYRPQERWTTAYLMALLTEHGIDLDRTEILPRIPQNQMRKIYACTDIGLFPNRCEGGTNLVLMEYMACGKPVIASLTSGHKDILTDTNSMAIRQLRPVEFNNGTERTEAVWEEPELDEIIEMLEFAYQYRNSITTIGKQAGEDMRQRTWTHTARDLLTKLGLLVQDNA